MRTLSEHQFKFQAENLSFYLYGTVKNIRVFAVKHAAALLDRAALFALAEH